MSQKPIRIIRRARDKAAQQPPAIVDSPDPTPTAENPAPAPGPLARVGDIATVGETLPDTSGGRVCQKCGAYVVLPDVHTRYHRKLNRFIDLVHEVFRRLGYITKAGDSAATDGNSHE